MDEFSNRLERLDIERDIPGLSIAIVDLFKLFFGAPSADVDMTKYESLINVLLSKCAGKVINWAVVVKNLDKTDLFIDSYPFFRAFIKHFNRISKQIFPASGLLTTGWKNAKHQLYLILFAANSLIPDEVDFNNLVSVDQRRLAGAPQPPNLSWLCLSLYETLLDLATVHGYTEEVIQALMNAAEHYPEYVCILLAQCDMRFGGMRGKKIQGDVLDYVLPKFLCLPGSRSTSVEVIRWLASINAEATLKLFRIALVRSMSFEDVSQTCLRLQSLPNSNELSKQLEESSNLQELLPLWCYNHDVFQVEFASKLTSLLKPNGDVMTGFHAKAISDFLCKHGKDLRLQKGDQGSLLSYETFYLLFSNLQRVERSLDRKVWNNLNSLNALQLYKQRATRSSSTTSSTTPSPQPFAAYLAQAQAGGGPAVVSPYGGTERAPPMTPEGASASGASGMNFVTPDQQTKMAHPLPSLPPTASVGTSIGGPGGHTTVAAPRGPYAPVTLSEVEKEANVLFDQMYRHRISLDEGIHRMKTLKLSARQHDQEVFRSVIHNFFDEYRFFGVYNDDDLDIAGNLMGMIINNSLVSSITLGIGLRYIIEAIRRNPADSELSVKFFFFGITAIAQFVGRLLEFSQYCSHLCQIVHFRELSPALCAEAGMVLEGRDRNYGRQRVPVPSLSEIKQYFLQHQHQRQQQAHQRQLQQQQQIQQQARRQALQAQQAQQAQQYHHHDAEHSQQQQHVQQFVSPWGPQQPFSAERGLPRPFPSMGHVGVRPGEYSPYPPEVPHGHPGAYGGISASSPFSAHGINGGLGDIRLQQSGTPTMMGMPPVAMTGLHGVLNSMPAPQPTAPLRVVLKSDLESSNTSIAEREDKYPVAEVNKEMMEQATKIGLGMTRQLSIKARMAIEAQNKPASPLKTLGLPLPNHYQDVLSDMVQANPNPLYVQSAEEKAKAAAAAAASGHDDDDTEKSDSDKEGSTLVDINSTSVTPSDRSSVAIVPSASDLTSDSIVVESSIKFGDATAVFVVAVPNESLKSRVCFCVNNIGADNMTSKLLELRGLLEEEHYNWFASYLVSNCVTTQINMQQMYKNLVESFESKLMVKCVLDHTYYNITKLLESDRIVSSSSDRLLLRNLGVWLGQLTLAKDKFVHEKRCNLKKLICWAFESGRLIAVLGFCTRVLTGLKESKVLRPPNPWVLGVFGLLRDLYEIDDLKLNLKFEVQVLCKNTDISMEDIPLANLLDKLAEPVGRVDGTNPDFNKKRDVKEEKEKVVEESKVAETVPSITMVQEAVAVASTLMASEEALPKSGEAMHAELPPLTLHTVPMIPNIENMVVLSDALPVLKTKPMARKAAVNGVDYAINQAILTTVGRVCGFALKSVSYLLRKDYAGCTDDATLRKAAKASATEVASSLASVTAQPDLRKFLVTNLSMLASQACLDPVMEDSFVNVVGADNLVLGCRVIANVARDRIEESINGATNIIEFLYGASGVLSVVDALPEAEEIRELIQAMPDYLKNPVAQVYADFSKVPHRQALIQQQYQTKMSGVDHHSAAQATASATTHSSMQVHSVGASGAGEGFEVLSPGLMQPAHSNGGVGSGFHSSGSPRESGGSPRSPNVLSPDSSPLDKISGHPTIDQYKIILVQMDEELDQVDKEAIASGKSMSMSQLGGDHLVLYLLRKLVVETQRVDPQDRVGIAVLCAEELFRKVMFLSSPAAQCSPSLKSTKSDVLVGAIEALRDACGGVKKWMGVDTQLWLNKFVRVDVANLVKRKIFVTCLSNLLRVKILSTDVLDNFFFDTIHNSGSNLKTSVSILDGSFAMLDESQMKEALQLGFLEVTLMFIKQVLCTGLANALDFTQVFDWVANAKPSAAKVRKQLKALLQRLVMLAQAKEQGVLSTMSLEDKGPALMSLYIDHVVESSQKVSPSGGGDAVSITSSTVLVLLKKWQKWQKKLESIPSSESSKRGKKKEKVSDKAIDEAFHVLLDAMQHAGILRDSATVDEFLRISIDLTCGSNALVNAVGVHPLSVVFVKLINMADDEASREQLLRRILDAYLFSLLNAGDCIADRIFRGKYMSLFRILLDETCEVSTVRYFVCIINAICPSKLPAFATAWLNVVSHQKVFKVAVQHPEVRVDLVPVISELLLFSTQENISGLVEEVDAKKQWIAVMDMVCRIVDSDPRRGSALVSHNCLEWLTLLPISVEGSLWISIRSLLTSCNAIGPIADKIDDLWLEKVLSPRYLKSTVLESNGSSDSLFVSEGTVEFAVLHDESLCKSIKTVLKNCSDQQAIEMSVGSSEEDSTTSSMLNVVLSQLRIKAGTGDASNMQHILRLAINTALKTASEHVSLSGEPDVAIPMSGPPGLKSTGTLPASTISFLDQLLDTGFARFISDLLRIEVGEVSPTKTAVKKEYMKYTVFQLVLDHARQPSVTSLIAVQALVMLLKDPGLKTADEHLLMRAILERALYRRKAKPATSYVSWAIHLLLREVCCIYSDLLTGEKVGSEYSDERSDEGEKDAVSPVSAASGTSSQKDEAELKEASGSVLSHDQSSISALLQKATKLALHNVGATIVEWEPVFQVLIQSIPRDYPE